MKKFILVLLLISITSAGDEMGYYFPKIEAFNAGNVDGLNTKGYVGAVFDGEYVYFSPYYNGAYHGNVLRFHIFDKFKSASAWDAYNAGNIDGLNTKGYTGAVFDGRYIYFSPYDNGDEPHGIVLRYDTTKPFKNASAWDSYDATYTDGEDAMGYLGPPAFDGRYTYFSPYYTDGTVLRYDTESPFKSSSSWVAYNHDNIDGLPTKGYAGAVFDGRYVYFCPYQREWGAVKHGNLLRYDTEKPFKLSSSWDAFNLTTIHADLKGFRGIAADEDYLYLAPYAKSRVLRYKLGQPLKSSSSYDHFDLSALYTYPRQYTGCFFYAQFVCFAPCGCDLLGYDRNYPFNSASSWGLKNVLTTDDLFCDGYQGVIGDGVYFYLVPYRASPSSGSQFYHGNILRLKKDPCPNQSPPSGPGSEVPSSYMEDDENSQISKTSSRATAYGLIAGDACFCFKDYGPEAFDINFSIDFEIRLTDAYTDLEGEPDEWTETVDGALCLSNTYGDLDDAYGTNDLNVCLGWDWESDEYGNGNYTCYLQLFRWGAAMDYMVINEDQTYYCRLIRNGDSAQLKVYSNSSRTNLLDTLTVGGFGTRKWRYIYLIRSGNEGGSDEISFWIQNVSVSA